MSPADLTPFQLLQKTANCFERLGVPYRVVGSMASMAYSEARLTNDIDFLVDLQESHIAELDQEFPSPDFYLSTTAAAEAIRTRHQFNIIHVPSGLKLDIIQRKETPFSQLDISLGQRLSNPGFYDAWFGSPENIILMKLRYYQEGGSEKHLRDIASILLIQKEAIDRDYLTHWAETLGVTTEWKLVQQRINKASP
ncbi:hypothetical protein [Planctopirus hydrillae]|uniref:hypothetical protein n=1 Tax=Planctopirus hydrillae TaxID=1841610 RepID=UPI0009F1A39C|nr:hypothetical protein [Planctopirus hydrillae]